MYFIIPRLNPLDAVYTYIPRMGMRGVEDSRTNEESIWGRVKADPSVDKRVRE